MAGSAFVLGGTGQIGRAISRALAVDGWNVTVGTRGSRPLPEELTELGVRAVHVDRSRDRLAVALSGGVELFVDVVPYERADAEQVLALAGLVGSVVAISTASVYEDDRGRSVDEATNYELIPRFPVPVPESHPTVAPGDATYSTKKVAIEQLLLEGATVPTVVVRPCAVYGVGGTASREWFFVKRALDERPHVILSYEGVSVFHTTAAANLAELVRLAAERRVTGIFNCGDPDPPTVLEISRLVADALGHARNEVLLPGPPPSESVGETPWTTPHAFVLDMTAAETALAYRPVTSYAAAVAEACAYLVAATRGRDWRDALPETARWLDAHGFDYDEEDRFLAELAIR